MYKIQTKFDVDYEIDAEQMKDLCIDVLRAFVTFCEKHKLKYFLAGGTLIGAVRHQGFIPWDDDIDVSMPRADFEKFKELASSGKVENYSIRSIDLTPEIYCRPFIRLVNDQYIAQVNVDEKFIPPWIDIHALDGLPTDLDENEKHWQIARFYKGWSKRTRTLLKDEKSLIRGIAKRIVFFPMYLIGPVHAARKLIEFGKKYDFYESEYIASYCAGYGKKERMPGWYFKDGEAKLYFEGMLCSVPPHYDLVLQHMYGENYLALPPKSKRKIHMLKAWKLKNKGC